MKHPISVLIVFLCCLIYQQALAVTFTIKVDKDNNITLFKDQDRLIDKFYTFTIAKNDRITFVLEKKTTKRILFNIKDVFERQVPFNFNDSVFSYMPAISTDENLTLSLKKNTFKLEAFVLLIGVEGERTKTAEFQFLLNHAPDQQSMPDREQQSVPNPGNDTREKDQEKSGIYNPGAMVYDALKISNSSEIYEDELCKIIQFYYSAQKIENIDNCRTVVAANPFLNTIINNQYEPKKRSKNAAQSGGQILSSLSLSSIGGLDVTNIADGLAIFLVKRTKQELSIAFFEKFYKILDDTATYKDLRTVFPQTYALLHSMGTEIYDYERYIQNLREAFKTDISELIVNLPGIIDNHEQFFNKHAAVKASLQSGFYLTRSLMGQEHPGDILANYPMEYLENVNRNVSAAVKVMQLISSSLRDTSSSDSNYWVGIKYLRQVVNDKKAFRIYLGLVYQTLLDNHDIVFDGGTKMSEYMARLATNYYPEAEQYKEFIAGYTMKVNEIDRMIRSYSKPANDSVAVELYAKYFKSFTGLLEYSSKVMELPQIKNIPKLQILKKELPFYFDISNSLVDITCDVNRRNYSSAINHLVSVYDKVFSKSEASDAAVDNSLSPNSRKMVINSIVKYGGVAAAIATAKSSQEVAQTIETAALPTGSSRIKRETVFNVSLNAYCGLFAGYERIKGIDPAWTNSKQKFNSFGVTAPVGVSISRGHSIFFIGTGKKGWNDNKSGFAGWSSSIFLSVIDIGALASFRFMSPESVSTVPQIQLKDIISPGLFFSLGIPKTPLSLNFGWQMGPLLRTVSDTVNTYSQSYSRWSIGLCVDIPIFNFYSLTKNPAKDKKK